MIRVADTTGTVAEYIYNGNGQRADKLIPSQNKCTVFHYDQNGSLITESTRTGNIKAEYVYLNGQPLAKIEGNNVYYYHNDHLGTPMMMTDGSGQIIWQGEFLPFGEALSITGSVTNNLRFPGQYYDSETGLHQNGRRDYKPEIGGRYVEADPTGIEEGTNHLYVYTSNNPMNRIDPLGLFWDGPDIDDPGTISTPEGSGSIFTCRQLARRIRQEGNQKYPWTPDGRNNHMRHCWASCRLSQLGGSACASIAGWVQEMIGVYDPADTEANAKGRNCASSGECVKCCEE